MFISFSIVDKFILFFLSGERFSSGRMFANSLLFVFLLFAFGTVPTYIHIFGGIGAGGMVQAITLKCFSMFRN